MGAAFWSTLCYYFTDGTATRATNHVSKTRFSRTKNTLCEAAVNHPINALPLRSMDEYLAPISAGLCD